MFFGAPKRKGNFINNCFMWILKKENDAEEIQRIHTYCREYRNTEYSTKLVTDFNTSSQDLPNIPQNSGAVPHELVSEGSGSKDIGTDMKMLKAEPGLFSKEQME